MERMGFILKSKMRLVMSYLPEKLSDEEMEEMPAGDKDENWTFSYGEFRLIKRGHEQRTVLLHHSLSMKANPTVSFEVAPCLGIWFH